MSKVQEITKLLNSQNSTEASQKGPENERQPDSEAGQENDSLGASEAGTGTGDDSGIAEGDEVEQAGAGGSGEGEQQETEVIREALDLEREQVNNQAVAIMNDRRQIDTIIGMLGANIPPEIAEAYKAHHNARIERELESLKRVLPAWNKPQVAEYEQKLIVGMAQKYGISKPELEFMATDHRLVKMIRDAALTQDWKAKHQTKAARAAPRATQSPQDALKRAQAPNASKQDKLRAINALIQN
jgi:hypothetical protein